MMNYTRLIITRYDEDLVVMPLALAVILAIAAPWVVGIGAIIALASGCRVFTEKRACTGKRFSQDGYGDWRE